MMHGYHGCCIVWDFWFFCEKSGNGGLYAHGCSGVGLDCARPDIVHDPYFLKSIRLKKLLEQR